MVLEDTINTIIFKIMLESEPYVIKMFQVTKLYYYIYIILYLCI